MKKAAVYCRVSTEEQGLENTSLATQCEACLRFAEDRGLKVRPEHTIAETYSGLTINRPKLQQVLNWIKTRDIDVLIIYSTDRFSRDGYDLLTLIRECDINGVELYCVTEDLGEGSVGQLMNFVRGWASGLEAARIKERTMRGKMEHARHGEIPAGFGRYQGYLGLRYDKQGKKLVHVPQQIEIAHEILQRALNGESSSRITCDLQRRGIKGASGGPIHKSSVNRVMANARVYAGIIQWNGIEIQDKVNPIITEEQAALIADRIRRNKERSYGFGKRKWLTGRVFCQLCGRRYNLDSKKGCYCNGADNRNPTMCQSPKLSLLELSALAYGTMISALSEPETIIAQAREAHDKWEKEQQVLGEMQQRKVERQHEREKRRRLLSFQHEHGGITSEEYVRRLRKIEKEGEEEIDSLAAFMGKPEPPTAEQAKEMFNRLQAYKPLRLHFDDVLRNPQDRLADDLAEKVGLKVIIGPPRVEGHKFSAQVLMNLPITAEEMLFPNEDAPIGMVLQSTS